MKRLNMLLLLLCALFGTAQIWMSYLRNSNARALHDTHTSIMSLKNEIKELEVEEGSLMRPERLRRVAHEMLGMGSPKPSQFIHLAVPHRRVRQ